METKHTPGPWQTHAVGDAITKLAICDNNGLSVLTVVDDGGVWFAAVFNGEDARRIVACVNACEGLDNDILAQQTEHGGLAYIFEQLKQAERQRDELLDALVKCEARLTHLAQDSVAVVAELKIARAAIAKATGASHD